MIKCCDGQFEKRNKNIYQEKMFWFKSLMKIQSDGSLSDGKGSDVIT